MNAIKSKRGNGIKSKRENKIKGHSSSVPNISVVIKKDNSIGKYSVGCSTGNKSGECNTGNKSGECNTGNKSGGKIVNKSVSHSSYKQISCNKYHKSGNNNIMPSHNANNSTNLTKKGNLKKKGNL